MSGSSVAFEPSEIGPGPAPAPPGDGEHRLALFRRILAGMPPGRLLDLGAGHGAFSTIGRELGWDVTAVDARTVRMPMTPGITWIESDVRTFDVSGYDCVALLGLLYHLGIDDQLDLLRRCAGMPTIIDTHHSIRPTTSIRGYQGHLYREPGSSAEELAAIPTASWGNTASFWATRADLVRMFHDAGFATVLADEPAYRVDRSFYLCL